MESVALQEVVEGEALAARFWVPQSVLGYLQVTHLTVDIAVQEGFHVYGRPVPQVYTPLTLTVDARGMEVGPIAYPPPETLTLPALGEALPVYAGRLRLRVPITMTGEAPAQLNLALAYQACDDRVCLLPDELQAEMVIGYKEHVG